MLWNISFPEMGENSTEDSVYGIASVSKHFTTLLLGQIMKEDGGIYVSPFPAINAKCALTID